MQGYLKRRLKNRISAVEVVYIAFDDFLDRPVFDTQVVESLKETVVRMGLRATLIAFEQADRFFRNPKKVLAKRRFIKSRARVRVILLPRVPGAAGLIVSQLVVTGLFAFNRRRLVFHCRASKGTLAVRTLKRFRPDVRVIFDVRGAESEEFAYSTSKRISTERFLRGDLAEKCRRLRAIEAKAIETADHYFCVSESLRSHMTQRYALPDDRIDVVPCGVSRAFEYKSEIRRRLRESLHIENRLVFAYAGSMNPGQLPDRMFALFRHIKDYLPEAFFILLTQDIKETKRFSTSEDIDGKSLLIDSVPNDEIPGVLCAADFGLLLRDSDPRNAVAAPIKFSEYMCCGLPAIITDTVRDACLTLERAGVGIVLPGAVPLDDLDYSRLSRDIRAARLSDNERASLSATMRLKYGWSSLTQKQLAVYSGAIRPPSVANPEIPEHPAVSGKLIEQENRLDAESTGLSQHDVDPPLQ